MSLQEDKKFLFLTSDDNKGQKDVEKTTISINDEKLFHQPDGEIPIKIINEVDSKIFEDSAYNAVEDISLKLELKMLQMNKELDLINEQIELLNIVNPENKDKKIVEFHEQIQKRKDILSELKKEYRDLGLFYKINDTMSSTIELTEQNFKKTKESPWGEKDEMMNDFVSFLRTANKLDANLSRFFGLKPQIDPSKKKLL